MLRVGPVVVVDVISKAIVIETILPWIRGAPSGGREGETGMIVGGVRMSSGRGGISIRVVTDGVCVVGDRRLVIWIINCAGTVEKLGLCPITSGIV